MPELLVSIGKPTNVNYLQIKDERKHSMGHVEEGLQSIDGLDLLRPSI
jgi:hypothetical protein